MARAHKQNFISRIVTRWLDRLLGAVSEGSFADQEEMYASHRTSRDYICSAIGTGAWGIVLPVLTVIVTQLVGVDEAGMISLAFVTGKLLMIVGNYGVRTYQVSDIDETHSFSDYQMHRVLTCAIMLIAGVVYCNLRGYDMPMYAISIGMYVYLMADAIADVYEARLQQMDKFYLAGISQAIRSVLAMVTFALMLLITRNLVASCIAMAVAAFLTFFIVTLPLTLFETPKSRAWTLAEVKSLFKQCFPLFLSLFLYTFIDNMPKFVMEGVLTYDNQLYFNVLYFPAQCILLIVQLVYNPLLVRLANEWADPSRRRRFDMATAAIFGVIALVTAIAVFIMGWIGIPIMSFLYGVDFEQFRGLSYIMIIAGGVTAAIDFLYQTITVLRRQGNVIKLYLITFIFALFVPILLINYTGLPGAVIGYLIVMCILLSLLIMEYVSIRMEFSRGAKWEPAVAGDMPTSPANPSSSARINISQVDGARARKRASSASANASASAPTRNLHGTNRQVGANRQASATAANRQATSRAAAPRHAAATPASKAPTQAIHQQQTQAAPATQRLSREEQQAERDRRERARKARVREEIVRQAKQDRAREEELAEIEEDTRALGGQRSTQRTTRMRPRTSASGAQAQQSTQRLRQERAAQPRTQRLDGSAQPNVQTDGSAPSDASGTPSDAARNRNQ